jgi:hypothetical protein
VEHPVAIRALNRRVTFRAATDQGRNEAQENGEADDAAQMIHHDQASAISCEVTSGGDRKTISYAVANLNTKSLTRLLWQSHAECIVVFPQGVEFLPWVMAGSMELGRATADGRRPAQGNS